MKLKTFAMALALTAFGSVGWASEVTLGDLTIGTPFAFATSPNASAAGGYMTITNTGTEADTLIAVEADFAGPMLHKTTVDDQGVARMEHQMGGIEIPAGETVELAPGGLHVMFMQLSEQMVEGESRTATLIFEKAGPVEVSFDILRPGTMPMKHNH